MSILLEKSFLLTEELGNMSVEMVGLFPRGHVTLIAGEPGIGKTWFMLSICKSVVAGDYGLGGLGMKYPKGRCLVFAGETGVRLLANRVSLMGGIEPLENCRVISSHECARLDIDVMMNTAIGRKNIEDAIREYKPDITFFDTMISFVGEGKDESKQVDISDTIRMLSGIASRNNTAMVILHHFRKRSSNVVTGANVTPRSMDEVIGSSAFTRLASLVIAIERRGQNRYVTCLKSWWKEFETFSFIIVTCDKEEGIYLQPSYEGGVTGTGVTVASRIYDKIMADFTVFEPFSIRDIACKYNVSRTTAADAINIGRLNGTFIIVDKDRNTVVYAKEDNFDADTGGDNVDILGESSR